MSCDLICVCVCVYTTYLVHRACWYKNRVSQELNYSPALDSMLIQQPLTLLPAQVPALLSDWVLVQWHVQSLLLTELMWLVMEGERETLVRQILVLVHWIFIWSSSSWPCAGTLGLWPCLCWGRCATAPLVSHWSLWASFELPHLDPPPPDASRLLSTDTQSHF